MRVIVSGGGTGGHILPILAVVEALQQQDKSVEVLYVGQAAGMESKIAAGAGLNFAGITAGKFRRYQGRSWRERLRDVETLRLNIRDWFRFWRGLRQSIGLVRQFRPDVIFIKGGYVGLPLGLAARLLRIPYVVHESDSVPGLTNRWLARRARRIAVGFPVSKYRDWDRSKLVYTGTPMRRQTIEVDPVVGKRRLKLGLELPTVLVVGGSSGAARINRVVVEALPELLECCQIIHIAGEQEIDAVRFEVKRAELTRSDRYHLYAFLWDEMGAALAAADVVISRGGANSLAELAVLAKPVVLIPHPQLVHQTHNALILSRAGAVDLLTESQLTPERLVAVVVRLLHHPEERERLSRAITQFARPDAAAAVAREILTVGAAAAKGPA